MAVREVHEVGPETGPWGLASFLFVCLVLFVFVFVLVGNSVRPWP
jgi:hypothetical protein